MARVKFKVDTIHPFYGAVKKGEVLKVTYEYLRDYEKLGVGEETDDNYSRPAKELES